MSTAFGSNRQARGTAIETKYEKTSPKDPKGRPVNIAVIGLPQADKSVPSTPYEVGSLSAMATVWGRKSTAFESVQELIPDDRVGVGDIPITVFPVEPSALGAQASGDVTPSGTCSFAQSYYVVVNNISSLEIPMVATETVSDWTAKAAIAMQGVLAMPVIATDGTTTLDLEVGFESAAGDYVNVAIISPDNAEMTFSITQPTGGAGSMDIGDAFDQWGLDWFSHVINALGDASDSAFLNAASDFNELLWAPEEYRPFKMYTGSSADLTTLTTISDARTTDKTNTFKPNPDSNDLPWVIAARQVATQAVIASASPPSDYCLKPCAGLAVGSKALTWSSGNRQSAVTKGCSTVEVVGGQIVVSDSIMCYHPEGEDPPGYQYDNDIEKICLMIYNLNLIFNDSNDAGKPLVPNNQTTDDPDIRKPNYFQSQCITLFENTALKGIISDPDYAIENTTITINGSNNRRVDAEVVYKIAGNANIFSVTQKFTR